MDFELFQDVLWGKSSCGEDNKVDKGEELRQTMTLIDLHNNVKRTLKGFSSGECLSGSLIWSVMKEYGSVLDDLQGSSQECFQEVLQMANTIQQTGQSEWCSKLGEANLDQMLTNVSNSTEFSYSVDEVKGILEKDFQELKTAASNQVIIRQEERSNDKQEDVSAEVKSGGSFRTAKSALLENSKKNKQNNIGDNNKVQGNGLRKTLGSASRSSVTRKFVSPLTNNNNNGSDDGKEEELTSAQVGDGCLEIAVGEKVYSLKGDYLKNVDHKMIQIMMNEILDCGAPVSWDDVAGLEFAKDAVKEIVIWPLLRPDIFTGLRLPHKGILLFGPPGTGKTLIGKCIASQCNSTFFSMSASSLTSKWIGEGEKLVRCLFAVARSLQPSVIFIDEIDSLLTQRNDTEHESSRRLKTEFLIQLDGANSSSEDKILILGATNRPQELDEAARRRLSKRLYIPLPDSSARCTMIKRLMGQFPNTLSSTDIEELCKRSHGYSGADMANLCKEASLGPIREIKDIQSIPFEQLRPIEVKDFDAALVQVKASVSQSDLDVYQQWNQKYGSWNHIIS